SAAERVSGQDSGGLCLASGGAGVSGPVAGVGGGLACFVPYPVGSGFESRGAHGIALTLASQGFFASWPGLFGGQAFFDASGKVVGVKRDGIALEKCGD